MVKRLESEKNTAIKREGAARKYKENTWNEVIISISNYSLFELLLISSSSS
jgi:hypothetical protein